MRCSSLSATSFIPAASTARATNGSLLYFIVVVIAAPVMEDIVFRGFRYRGLAETRLGRRRQRLARLGSLCRPGTAVLVGLLSVQMGAA